MATGATEIDKAAPGDAMKAPSFKGRDFAVLFSVCLAQFIVAFSNSSVLMALPTIAREFGLSSGNLEWPIISFNLSFGALLILSGRVADMFGRRRVLVFGLVWLGIWAIVIGFSKTEVLLNVSRAMQGVGAAINVPACIGVLATYFSDQRRRNLALSFFGAMNPLGFIVGSILGGVITKTVSWNAVFFIPAGLTFLSAGISWLSLPADESKDAAPNPDTKERPSSKLDILGAFLITAAIVTVTFALSAGTSAPSGFATWYIILCFALFPVFLGLFVFWQFKATSPLMPLWLWKSPGFASFIGVAALILWAFQTFALYTTLFLQNVYQYDPLTAAIHQIPMAVSGMLAAVGAGYLVSHYKNIPVLLLGGFVLMLIACILMATAYPETSYWLRAFPALILIVSGFDIVWNTLSISVVSLVPPHSRSLAGGVFNTAAQFGIAIGLAIDGVIVSAIIGDRQTGPTVYAEAYRAAFWTSVAVIVATGVIVAAFVRGSVGGTGKPHGHEQGKEGKDAKLENKPGSKDLESAIVDSADSVVTDA